MKEVESIQYVCQAGEIHIDAATGNRTYIGEWGSAVLSVLIKIKAINITPIQFNRLFCEVFQPMTPQGFNVITIFKN